MSHSFSQGVILAVQGEDPSCLTSENCFHLAVVFRFDPAPLHFEVRGGGVAFQATDRTVGKAAPLGVRAESHLGDRLSASFKAVACGSTPLRLKHLKEEMCHYQSLPRLPATRQELSTARPAQSQGVWPGLAGESLPKLGYPVNGVGDPKTRAVLQAVARLGSGVNTGALVACGCQGNPGTLALHWVVGRSTTELKMCSRVLLNPYLLEF